MALVRVVLGGARRAVAVRAMLAAVPLAACFHPNFDHEACSDRDDPPCQAGWHCNASKLCVPDGSEDAMLVPDSPPSDSRPDCASAWLGGPPRLVDITVVAGLPTT